MRRDTEDAEVVWSIDKRAIKVMAMVYMTGFCRAMAMAVAIKNYSGRCAPCRGLRV